MSFKKIISFVLCLTICFLLSGCAEKPEDVSSQASPKPEYVGINIRLGVLSNDFSIPVAKLMHDTQNKTGANRYAVSVFSDENEVLDAILSETVDIAMLSLKNAADAFNQLYEINMLNIGTASGIWIVENGATITELSELKDKTVGIVGQGSQDDNLLRFVMRLNKINPDEGIDFKYYEDEQQLSEALVNDRVSAAVMPQLWAVRADEAYPEATLNRRINLCDEWLTLRNTEYPEYCFVVRSSLAKQHPSAVRKFNEELKEAARYASSNRSEVSELCEKYGILSAAQAEECLRVSAPSVISGSHMEKTAVGYYSMMFSFDYTAMGGKQPVKEFYFK